MFFSKSEQSSLDSAAFLAEMDDHDPLHKELLEMKANLGVKVIFENLPLVDFCVANWKAIQTLLIPLYKTYCLLQLRICTRPASRSWYK